MDHLEGAGLARGDRVDFDRRVRLEFRGAQISSDGGLLVMIAAGCAAGAQGSGTMIGAAAGAVLMTVTVGPIFAIGCVSRANLSDRMESKQRIEPRNLEIEAQP